MERLGLFMGLVEDEEPIPDKVPGEDDKRADAFLTDAIKIAGKK